jgi:hypothetical protein
MLYSTVFSTIASPSASTAPPYVCPISTLDLGPHVKAAETPRVHRASRPTPLVNPPAPITYSTYPPALPAFSSLPVHKPLRTQRVRFVEHKWVHFPERRGRLSWKEVAAVFHTPWEKVFRSVEMAVAWGCAHPDLSGIAAIGIDEIQWQRGRNVSSKLRPRV